MVFGLNLLHFTSASSVRRDKLSAAHKVSALRQAQCGAARSVPFGKLSTARQAQYGVTSSLSSGSTSSGPTSFGP